MDFHIKFSGLYILAYIKKKKNNSKKPKTKQQQQQQQNKAKKLCVGKHAVMLNLAPGLPVS